MTEFIGVGGTYTCDVTNLTMFYRNLLPFSDKTNKQKHNRSLFVSTNSTWNEYLMEVEDKRSKIIINVKSLIFHRGTVFGCLFLFVRFCEQSHKVYRLQIFLFFLVHVTFMFV